MSSSRFGALQPSQLASFARDFVVIVLIQLLTCRHTYAFYFIHSDKLFIRHALYFMLLMVDIEFYEHKINIS